MQDYCHRLLALHEMMLREGGLLLHSHRFFIEGVRPAV